MADDQPEQSEKTEEPTHKRLEDAHRRGDVAKSQEVNAWFVMVAATLVVVMFGDTMMRSLATGLEVFIARPHEIAMDGEHLRAVSRKVGLGVFAALLLPIVVLLIGAVGGNLIQHKPMISSQALNPKLSKISPMSGWKRLFSGQSLANFLKGLAKLTVVGAVMFVIIWPERDRLDLMVTAEVAMLLPVVKALAVKLLVGVIAIMTIIAGLDFLYQRHSWMQKQRMTVKEMRDEHKQMEGDPTVKAKLRQVRIERGRKRMMANVPKASVVITNPTHFAVALQYEAGMSAPVCVAKGIDAIALKIREIAEGHDIPIVENPPLARTLHASVEVDQEIPPEHYKAVAQVIGYVMKIRGKLARRKARGA